LETIAKNRETLSLAAAAAEGKGLELRQKGLELFAEAIDPDWQRRQESNEQGRRERRHKNHEQENAPPKTGPLSAAALRELATESAEQSPLLAMLNRLPGKNGQRWVVLPFSFCESGREYRVSLRILLEPDSKMPQRAACMALDIAEIGETERNWLFVLDKANGLTPRLNVYLQPELPPQDLVSLGGELARLMEMPLEHISVKTRAESFPCEAGGKDDLLRSINEAV
jgi:hypothetical protein